MNRSRRGAAKISVVWMIAVVVMFLVAFVMAVAAYQDRAAALELQAAAIRSEQAELERAQEASAEHTTLSQNVGWTDPNAATPDTNVDQLQAALDEYKSSYDLGEDVKTLEGLLPKMRSAYLNIAKENNTLKQTIASLESEKSAIDQQMRSSIRGKDEEIASLRSQLSDSETAASSKQQELEGRVASLRAQVNTLDEEKLRIAADSDVALRQRGDEVQSLMTRLNTQADKLNPIEKSPELPDGKVLAVSKDLAWIDLGTRDRLNTGMRFRVIDGQPGSERLKAWATVTDKIERDMAQVQLSEIADRFDPVVAGDILYNRLYDPRGERFAVLAGRFSGSLNESELTELLRDMNIRVQKDGIDINTDFLIVGSDLYVDPDTQEPLEEPLPVSELPVYKDAQAAGGITILPLKDLRAYFTF